MLGAAHGSLMLAGYVIAVVLARELGPAMYGVYGIVYSVLLGTEQIGRLGVPQALSRCIAERGVASVELEATGSTLTALIYLVVFAAFWALAPQLASAFRVEDGAALFRIAAIDIPFFGLYVVGAHILNGRRAFAAESVGVAVYAGAKVIGILLLLLIGVTIAGALIVNAAASVVALGYVAWRVGAPSLRPRLIAPGALLRVAVPIALFALGSQLLASLDLWALNALGSAVGEEVKGWYVAATNLARLPNAAAFVLSAVLIPSIARALAAHDVEAARRSTEGAVRFLAVVLLPAVAIAVAEAPEAMSLVFSDAYREGGPLLSLLAISHGLFYTVFVSLCVILIGAGREREAAVISVAVLPLAVLCNAALIAPLGARGAALAAIIAAAAGTLAAGLRVRRRVGPLLAPSLLIKIALASLGVWGLASLVNTEGLALLVEIGALAALYLAALYATGSIGPEDLAHFRTSEGSEAREER